MAGPSSGTGRSSLTSGPAPASALLAAVSIGPRQQQQHQYPVPQFDGRTDHKPQTMMSRAPWNHHQSAHRPYSPPPPPTPRRNHLRTGPPPHLRTHPRLSGTTPTPSSRSTLSYNLPNSSRIPAAKNTPPSLAPDNKLSAAVDLLPYCTARPAPLTQDQALALSDVVGDMRELVLLALGAAAGEAECVQRLESAVGTRCAAGIVEFFVSECEVE